MSRGVRVLVAGVAIASAFWSAAPARATQPHLLIVGGLGGEPYYTKLFHRWVDTLAEVGARRLGIPEERLIRLEESPAPADDAGPRSDKPAVLDAIEQLAGLSAPGDVVAVFLFGHGTATGERALFNLPGPDLSASELDAALAELAGRTVAVVVATPASAPFIDALSGPGRVIITATASAAENQHTRFGGHLVDALADDAADGDKDGRISLLEAFRYADRETERSYEIERLLRAEHAMLDDNGDGIGSREPGRDGDGSLAARVHLASPSHAPDTAAGRAALALEVEARRLVDRIEALKRDKPVLPPDRYRARLESLLVELALNRRAYGELQ